jgi:hypothetical protein
MLATTLFMSQFGAVAIALAMLHMGITSYMNPTHSTGAVGVPQRPPINPWVYMFAARETGVALAMLVFAYLGDWRAVGIVFAALLPVAGPTDVAIEAKFGRGVRTAVLRHGVPASFCLPIIYFLVTS